jgi:signal transduction histidine kinase
VTLRRLKWVVVLAVVAFLGLVEYLRVVLVSVLPPWQSTLLTYGLLVIAVVLFTLAVFGVIERMQQVLAHRNRELLALHDAGIDVTRSLALESVLQRVVDSARELVGARYGALAIYRNEGPILKFLTSGISMEERAAIGDPPEGRGLLGLVRRGEPLRLRDLSRHQDSVGFPAHHPLMRSLLAVPIVCSGARHGNLYVSEREGGVDFSAEDEQTLVRFATQAAIAIDNAYLHDQVRVLAVVEERQRIAHEMHDGLAQVLAFVNAKAQAVKEHFRRGRSEEAAQQMEELAGAARESFSEVREAILGLRSTARPERLLSAALSEYVHEWQHLSQVTAALTLDKELEVPPKVEIQLLRIVQEALANVRKHAQATKVRIQLKRVNGGLTLSVEDDGVGFDLSALGRSQFPRFGLATMRERAESVGGTIDFETSPGKGTLVLLHFPL